MREVSFEPPSRVVLEPQGARIWGYVMRFEAGRVWVVPGDEAPVRFGEPVRLSFEGQGPTMTMTGVVTWIGVDALAIDVAHFVDRQLTAAWALGRPAPVPRAAA